MVKLEKLNLTKRDGIVLGKNGSLIIGFQIPCSRYESQNLAIRCGSFETSDLRYNSKNKEATYKSAIDRAMRVLIARKVSDCYFFKGEIVFYTQESNGTIKKQTPLAFMWGAFSEIEFFSKTSNMQSYIGRSYNKPRKQIAILKGIAKGYDISIICLNDKGEVGVSNTKTLSVHKHSFNVESQHNITNGNRFTGFGKGSGNDLELLISSDGKMLFLKDAKTNKIIGIDSAELKNGVGILGVAERNDGISFKINMRESPLKVINAIWNIVDLWYLPKFKQVKMQVNYSDKDFDAVTFADCEIVKDEKNTAWDLEKAYYIGTHATQNLKADKSGFMSLSLQKNDNDEICTNLKCFVNDDAVMPIINSDKLNIFNKDEAVAMIESEDLETLQ